MAVAAGKTVDSASATPEARNAVEFETAPVPATRRLTLDPRE
jgi:hypothetical protein